jgi:hypothetical protein
VVASRRGAPHLRDGEEAKQAIEDAAAWALLGQAHRQEEARRHVEQERHLRLKEEAKLQAASPPDPRSSWEEA